MKKFDYGNVINVISDHHQAAVCKLKSNIKHTTHTLVHEILEHLYKMASWKRSRKKWSD